MDRLVSVRVLVPTPCSTTGLESCAPAIAVAAKDRRSALLDEGLECLRLWLLFVCW